jgi:hypothetical protein
MAASLVMGTAGLNSLLISLSGPAFRPILTLMERRLQLRGRDYAGMTCVVVMCLLIGVAVAHGKALWVTGPLMLLILALWTYGRYLPSSDQSQRHPATAQQLPPVERPVEATAPAASDSPGPSGFMALAVILACTVGGAFILIVIAYIDLASHPG